jgi:decaprenylphospho-beta-D-ribofuranose 2-oxidase
MMLSGWGRYPRAECRVIAPRDRADVMAAVATRNSLIARGNGRSYGDSALNPDATLATGHADRFIAFDPATGTLEAEAGVLLSEILKAFVPRGWCPAVTPGTKYVSLGGMIAADVHGKNHHKAGSFGAHVESFDLVLADGRFQRCSRNQNADLFEATLGGMGLTGVILSARIRLQPIETRYIRQEILRARDLDEVMALFEASRDWAYTVAWVDCLARGAALGRAILYRGEHSCRENLPEVKRVAPLQSFQKRARRVPIELPSFALNRWSVAAFNWAYYHRATTGTTLVDYDTFFYPLDTVLDWNRIYGRSGFVQYQCVLPKAESRAGLVSLLGHISGAGAGSFLSVLKLLGPGRGMLSFPIEGYTLALDFRADCASLTLLSELDTIVASHGGRIYLAKDARLAAETFQEGYSTLDSFIAVRDQVDPGHKFASLQSRRLGL